MEELDASIVRVLLVHELRSHITHHLHEEVIFPALWLEFDLVQEISDFLSDLILDTFRNEWM